MKKPEQQKLIAEIKEMRVNVDGITQLAQSLDVGSECSQCEIDSKNPDHRRSSEISIAITKLQEGKMWLGKLLQGIGAENPYPNSMNSDNEIIEPPADVVKPPALPSFDAKVGEELTHIKRIKQLRQMIENIISSEVFSDKEIEKIGGNLSKTHRIVRIISFANSFSYLTEAKMWLGMELGRIKQESQ